ncbi:MAG: hypothetical protein JO165_02470 [Candidatus Eremiobacteraeota bacterium]|nr:hypothetical protein [Candidatus Eremiobacteraeota bacterium]
MARDLIGYQHSGERGFLQHVATVSSFALPVGGATSAAGRAIVFITQRLLPAVFLFVDENRLNILKWFPKWGPKMLYYSDILQKLLLIYNVGQLAHSGYGFFTAWREVKNARAVLEAGAELSNDAEAVAKQLEAESEKIFSSVDQIRESEPSVGAAVDVGVKPVEVAPGAIRALPDGTTIANQLAKVEGLTDAQRAVVSRVPADAWERLLERANALKGKQSAQTTLRGFVAEELFLASPQYADSLSRAIERAKQLGAAPESVEFVRDVKAIAPKKETVGGLTQIFDGAIVARKGDKLFFLTVFESKSLYNAGELATREGEFLGQIGMDFERMKLEGETVVVGSTSYSSDNVYISRNNTEWLGVAPPEATFGKARVERIAAQQGFPTFRFERGPLPDATVMQIAAELLAAIP